jgi:hypothetical protein
VRGSLRPGRQVLHGVRRAALSGRSAPARAHQSFHQGFFFLGSSGPLAGGGAGGGAGPGGGAAATGAAGTGGLGGAALLGTRTRFT